MPYKRGPFFNKCILGDELLQIALAIIYKNCNKQQKADVAITRFLKYAAENTLKGPYMLSAYLLNIPFFNKEYFHSEAHKK